MDVIIYVHYIVRRTIMSRLRRFVAVICIMAITVTGMVIYNPGYAEAAKNLSLIRRRSL